MPNAVPNITLSYFIPYTGVSVGWSKTKLAVSVPRVATGTAVPNKTTSDLSSPISPTCNAQLAESPAPLSHARTALPAVPGALKNVLGTYEERLLSTLTVCPTMSWIVGFIF